jgi:hypothetical protein
LPDDFVLIGADEMPQKPLGGLLVNKRGKATTFWPSPGVQLDHMMAVIDSPLKRCRVPHFSNRRPLKPRVTKQTFTGPGSQQIACEVFAEQIRVKQPRSHLVKKKVWKFLSIAVYRLLDQRRAEHFIE